MEKRYLEVKFCISVHQLTHKLAGCIRDTGYKEKKNCTLYCRNVLKIKQQKERNKIMDLGKEGLFLWKKKQKGETKRSRCR